MKDILFFCTSSCPHCKQADEDIKKLKEEFPKYQPINVRKVDENLNPQFAEKFDYYYVPCMYCDGKKMIEGDASRENLINILVEALK